MTKTLTITIKANEKKFKGLLLEMIIDEIAKKLEANGFENYEIVDERGFKRVPTRYKIFDFERWAE